MYITLVFIYGLLIGSFLNVCIYRIPRRESITFPPSHCAKCGERLKWYDLIPVISYLWLRGRCRNCKNKISVKYPVVELLTAIVFCLIYFKYGLSFSLIKYLFLACSLIVIGIIDYETTDVYTSISIFGLLTGIVFTIIGYYLYKIDPLNYIFGAVIGGAVIALIVILTKGMGWGDVEICSICGLYVGFKYALLLLILSFIIGGISGMFLILMGKKKS